MMDGWVTTGDSAVSDFEEHLDGPADHAGRGQTSSSLVVALPIVRSHAIVDSNYGQVGPSEAARQRPSQRVNNIKCHGKPIT